MPQHKPTPGLWQVGGAGYSTSVFCSGVRLATAYPSQTVTSDEARANAQVMARAKTLANQTKTATALVETAMTRLKAGDVTGLSQTLTEVAAVLKQPETMYETIPFPCDHSQA